MKNQKITDPELEDLEQKDYFILTCLVKRKLKSHLCISQETATNTPLNRNHLLTLIRESKTRRLSKRVEENRKLVISMVVKHLKD